MRFTTITRENVPHNTTRAKRVAGDALSGSRASPTSSHPAPTGITCILHPNLSLRLARCRSRAAHTPSRPTIGYPYLPIEAPTQTRRRTRKRRRGEDAEPQCHVLSAHIARPGSIRFDCSVPNIAPNDLKPAAKRPLIARKRGINCQTTSRRHGDWEVPKASTPCSDLRARGLSSGRLVSGMSFGRCLFAPLSFLMPYAPRVSRIGQTLCIVKAALTRDPPSSFPFEEPQCLACPLRARRSGAATHRTFLCEEAGLWCCWDADFEAGRGT